MLNRSPSRPPLRLFVVASLLAAACVPAVAQAGFLPGATPGPHALSPAGIHFIANYEKLRLVPYNDPVHCTIGYGHMVDVRPCGHPAVRAKLAAYMPFTRAKAEALYGQDLAAKVACVNAVVTAPLTQSQFDALVSFAFNAGCGSIANVAPKINAGNLEGAARQMASYNKGWVWVGQGKRRRRVKQTMLGLVRRRAAENRILLGKVLPPAPGGTSPRPAPAPALPIEPQPDLDVHAGLLPEGSEVEPPAEDPVICPRGAAAQYRPVPDGCYQFSVDVIPSFLPSDPGNRYGFGKGAGRVEIEVLGETITCTNSSPCSYTADLPVGTEITITQEALSVAGGPADPGDPVDSEFDEWGGDCSGSDSCSFTLDSNHMAVVAYFVPALVTLDVDESGAGDNAEVIVSAIGGGSKPRSPVYCGALSDLNTLPLPCQVQVRKDVSVSAHAVPGPGYAFRKFSGDPCAASTTDNCVAFMDRDKSITADFGAIEDVE